MERYELKPFSHADYEQAKKAWEAIAGTDAFDVEFAPFFAWVETHITPREHDSVALQLANNEANGRVDAIVEIVDSRGGALSKLLKIVFSPLFWDVSNSRQDIITLYVEIFSQFITSHCVILRQRKVKLYGRDDDMMSILRSLHSHWSVPGSSADFEGRFLTISIS